MNRAKAEDVTRAHVEAAAADVRKPVLEVLTLLQAAAAYLSGHETLCAIKAEILAERGQ